MSDQTTTRRGGRLGPLILISILGLVLTAAPSEAHFQNFSQAVAGRIQGLTVVLDAAPGPLYPNATFNWTTYIADFNTSKPVPGAQGYVTILAGPAEQGARWNLSENRTNPIVYTASAALPEAGTYEVAMGASGNGSSGQIVAPIRVFRNLGARIVPENAAQDLFVNESNTLGFYTMRNGSRADVWPDLRIQLQRWSDDHRILYQTINVTLGHEGVGLFAFSYNFPIKGMYHMYFASQLGGFGFNDTPLLHGYAIIPTYLKPSDPGGPFGLPIPAASPAATVASILVAAFGLAWIPLRRRR